MFRPTYPTPDVPVITDVRPAPVQPTASAARPVVQITPATLAVGGGAVLVLGTVLVSLLLAVAVTAGSLAVLALVVRSLNNQRR